MIKDGRLNITGPRAVKKVKKGRRWVGSSPVVVDAQL